MHTKLKLYLAQIITSVALCLTPFAISIADSDPFDITEISFEELLQTEFIPASYIAKQISGAPSAVSVVTAQDIHDFGYKSLADVLKSMRGLYVTTSLSYEFLGGRGFGKPGDYAGRIMLVIDGYVTNDNYFNQIFLGEDGLLDVDLIDRVEFIPGPGSTSYGNSAFLGVINIITKKGSDLDGAQLAIDLSDQHQRRKTLKYGKQFDNGADVLLAASQYDDEGFYHQYATLDDWTPFSGSPFTNSAIGPLKKDSNDRIFFKGHYEGWTLELARVRRSLQKTTFAATGEPMDMDHLTQSSDKNSSISLKYDTSLNKQLQVSNHLYFGEYLYHLNSSSSPGLWEFAQNTSGRWWGADVKFIGTWIDNHKLLFGSEYRNDFHQSYSDIFVDLFTSEQSLSRSDSRMETLSLYLQDEYRVSDSFTLVPGIRLDRNTLSGSHLSPRFAAIYQPNHDTTIKLSYGKAFRFANSWERLTELDQDNKPEQVSTLELVWQQQLADKIQLTASLYKNKVTDIISYDADESLHTVGQELGLDYISSFDTRIKASVAHQITQDQQNNWLVNSPRWIGKLNIVKPLFEDLITAGVELQTISRRIDYLNQSHGSDTLINLNLSSQRLLKNTDISLTVKNLFATSQTDIYSDSLIYQTRDTRTVWLKMEYSFQ